MTTNAVIARLQVCFAQPLCRVPSRMPSTAASSQPPTPESIRRGARRHRAVAQTNDDAARVWSWNATTGSARAAGRRSRGTVMARSRHNPAWPRRSAAVATLALLSASVLLAPGAILAATPADGGSITIFPVAINASTGSDEYDPHVSGDIVSYTASDKV